MFKALIMAWVLAIYIQKLIVCLDGEAFFEPYDWKIDKYNRSSSKMNWSGCSHVFAWSIKLRKFLVSVSEIEWG